MLYWSICGILTMRECPKALLHTALACWLGAGVLRPTRDTGTGERSNSQRFPFPSARWHWLDDVISRGPPRPRVCTLDALC